MTNPLVERAPCVFCGYNGRGFFQAGTHHEDCPWHNIGGVLDRYEALDDMPVDLIKQVKQLRDLIAEGKLMYASPPGYTMLSERQTRQYNKPVLVLKVPPGCTDDGCMGDCDANREKHKWERLTGRED